MTMREGGCLCGAVRYRVEGPSLRVGLCHCGDCRKESGSSFVTFAVWPRAAFSAEGAYATFEGRSFCPACGARLFCLREDEAELRAGSLDAAPNGLAPAYEAWVKRRESWLPPQPGVPWHEEDKPDT